MYGQHFDLAEEASVELLPDRGSLSFPVSGSMLADAIMAAVDESGEVLFKMRMWQSNWGRWFSEVEVLVCSGLGQSA